MSSVPSPWLKRPHLFSTPMPLFRVCLSQMATLSKSATMLQKIWRGKCARREMDKKKGGGKKHLSPERSVNPKKKLSPIQQLQLQDQQHAQVSQVAPSGRVAGPTPVAGFQSRDILTPYAPLSSLNPDGRHESRRRGQAQQVFWQSPREAPLVKRV